MADDDLLDSIRSRLAADVAARFKERGEIIEDAIDLFSDELDEEELAEVVARLHDEVVVADQAAQATWPPVTDCDRLDAAFGELDARGILARHHWSCCQTCGHGEMPEEAEQVRATRPVRGYAFYHEQDTEAVVEGAGLFLAYGAFEEGRTEEAIAAEVVAVLREHGLAPTWDGRAATRIVVPMVWQRRARPATT